MMVLFRRMLPVLGHTTHHKTTIQPTDRPTDQERERLDDERHCSRREVGCLVQHRRAYLASSGGRRV